MMSGALDVLRCLLESVLQAHLSGARILLPVSGKRVKCACLGLSCELISRGHGLFYGFLYTHLGRLWGGLGVSWRQPWGLVSGLGAPWGDLVGAPGFCWLALRPLDHPFTL